MALVDPTGLYALAIQKLVAVVEKEIGKVVYFKSAFTEMVEEFRRWKPYLEGLDKVSDPDPAVNFWLKDLQEWLEALNSLIQDCQALDQESSLSRWNVFRKRELYERIRSTRQDFENLLKKVPVVNMRKLVVQSRNCYLEQPIPKHLVSMDDKLEEILEALMLPASNEWVGIWGQGGSGKTVLAKQVNNSDLLDDWFQQILFLVVGGAANKKQVLKDLCELVNCEFHEHNPQSVLYNALKGRKVLLIVDDVWDGKILDALDVVVDGSCGSKIFVTTRNRDLLVQKHARIFSAGLMHPEASKRLFYNHAFGATGCPERLRESADKIIELCKGLPLALAVVGSAMAGKAEVHQWSYAAQTIKQNCLVRDQEMRGLFQCAF